MKYKIFIVIFSFSSLVSAQNLTLAQLLEIKKMDLGTAEEYLTSKGWEFLDAEEPFDEKLGKASFSFNKSDSSDFSESFLTYLFSEISDFSRLSIQINNRIKYNEYLNTIKSYGCKLIDSKIENGEIIKIYRGATTTFQFTTAKGSNYYDVETAVWVLFIVSNDDFDLNFLIE